MEMFNKLMTFCLLVVSINIYASDTLCDASERNYFSCKTTAGKVVSLCGDVVSHNDGNADPVISESPWLQFRLGVAGRIEVVYPLQKGVADGFVGQVSETAQGGAVGVVFVKNRMAYSVESVSSVNGIFSGLVVADPGYYGFGKCGKSCFSVKKYSCKGKPFFGENGDEFFMLANYLKGLSYGKHPD